MYVYCDAPHARLSVHQSVRQVPLAAAAIVTAIPSACREGQGKRHKLDGGDQTLPRLYRPLQEEEC